MSKATWTDTQWESPRTRRRNTKLGRAPLRHYLRVWEITRHEYRVGRRAAEAMLAEDGPVPTELIEDSIDGWKRRAKVMDLAAEIAHHLRAREP